MKTHPDDMLREVQAIVDLQAFADFIAEHRDLPERIAAGERYLVAHWADQAISSRAYLEGLRIYERLCDVKQWIDRFMAGLEPDDQDRVRLRVAQQVADAY